MHSIRSDKFILLWYYPPKFIFFLNTANSFERRSDIRYLVIGGTNSNIEEDITNKVISQIYPEFIDGSADGVVSLESAYLKGADEFFYGWQKFLRHLSWQRCSK